MGLWRVAGAVVIVVTSLVSVPAPQAVAATNTVTTAAGGVGYGDPLKVAQNPSGLVVSGDRLYISDFRETHGWGFVNHIRVVDLKTGVERTLAGTGAYGGPTVDGIPATSASLWGPGGLDVDERGRVYFAQNHNSLVRMVDEAGMIRTVAGGGPGQYDVGDGRLATDAFLYSPSDVELDVAGNLYIADTNANRVRRVDRTTGIISTVAGSGTSTFGGDGGPATSAGIGWPSDVAFDRAGNLFIADSGNNRVRKVAPDGIITTVAGGGDLERGTEGPATAVRISVRTVAVDGEDTLHLSDYGLVRKVDAAGVLRTVAGNGQTGSTTDGNAPGVPEDVPAVSSPLFPGALTFDGAGNLYVGDYLRVRRIDRAGMISTVAGNGMLLLGGDGGPAPAAQVFRPGALEFDRAGNLYVGDGTARIRKVSASGTITSIAGKSRIGGVSGDGGLAADADIGGADGIVADPVGNLYFSDAFRVRKIDTAGILTTVAGGWWYHDPPRDGIPATSAYLQPSGLTLDPEGNLYVSDQYTGSIRRVDRSGIITLVAGGGSPADGVGDGLPAREAHFKQPTALKFDALGRLLVLDRLANRVRRIDLDGTVTTVAGNGEYGLSGDGGPATAAALALGGWPGGLTVDASGSLFIVDTGNQRVRKVDPEGTITTFAGRGFRGFAGDGGPATEALFSYPVDAALDASGNLHVSDGDNHRIRRIAGAGGPPAVPASAPVWATTTTTSTPSTTTSSSTSTTSTSTTSTSTTTVPSRVSVASPYSTWAQPQPTPLDGLGTWIATGNDPAAGPGQVAPAYFYGLGFGFANSPAAGSLGLVKGPMGKVALFSVRGPDGTPRDAAVAFDWRAGRLYYPYVYQLAPGRWGAWIFDQTANAWVGVGVLSLPSPWGKLAPTNFTAVSWFGATAASCSAFPRADAFFHPPTGYVGGTATVATLTAHGSGPGDCPAQTTLEHAGVWARYRVGAL